MTINEAVDMVDRLKPNQYDHEQKVKWLSKLDGMIFKEVISTHACSHAENIENCTAESTADSHIDAFTNYDDAMPETELLVPFPYDEDVYNYFLQMQIDKENGEMKKYNQSAMLYNNAYKTFCDWYNRTHLPLPARSEFKF